MNAAVGCCGLQAESVRVAVMAQTPAVVVITYPVFGHIIPLLSLSKKLAQHGFQVHFVVSAVRIPQIHARNLLTESDLDTIHLFPMLDDVSVDMDSHVGPTLREETAVAMQAAFDQLFKPQIFRAQFANVELVICDLFCSHAVKLLHQLQLSIHVFNASSMTGLASMLRLTDDSSTVDSQAFLGSLDADNQPTKRILSESSKRFMLDCNTVLPLAKSVISNSVIELEEEAYKELSEDPRLRSTNIVAIGPLTQGAKTKADDSKILSWLDRQPQSRSVVYISFGSMLMISAEQIRELGLALLQSGHPFVWSLKDELRRFVPVELSDTANQRHQILPWVPQRAVLKHASIGVFVTHCGWNSTLEGVACGVPMLLWPSYGDQFANADLMVSRGVGVKLPGTGLRNARLVSAEEIVRAIEEISAENYWMTAQKWMDICTCVRNSVDEFTASLLNE